MKFLNLHMKTELLAIEDHFSHSLGLRRGESLMKMLLYGKHSSNHINFTSVTEKRQIISITSL
jgi:hypothetical protein